MNIVIIMGSLTIPYCGPRLTVPIKEPDCVPDTYTIPETLKPKPLNIQAPRRNIFSKNL